ncbi:MAG: 1-deoxy-D-xylulose-5-phosphate reductoisomerase [Oscillospiraceae bacterium]|jgi:1-deoxy-D-xylulose-5-phosphate reductoisomerase|nr:1-deoxy-D-xylulose-5-phosphate reductoisomerase [Oscillospiraceae bacterium]
MNKTISILGSTGSIGVQALEVASKLGLRVCGLSSNVNIELLEAQIRQFKPAYAAVMNHEAAQGLKIKTADLSTKILEGMEGFLHLAAIEEADIVLNSVVGMVGLKPTLAAIAAGKDVALANKETLVAGGGIVMEAAKAKGVKILPVDSEHSAIFQCLQGLNSPKELKKIILTASGGPFFGRSRAELAGVKKEQALKHPNWDMGAKITIDSASMMNKGLEVIEAVWLFGLPQEKIDVVVHRESIIHSLVEFADSSVLAQLGLPDMRIPIQYALTWPQRYPSPAAELDLAAIGRLSFYPPDDAAFACLPLCREAITRGGLYPAAANSANEEAVALFLQDKIDFLQIPELVAEAMEKCGRSGSFTLEDVLAVDEASRKEVKYALFKN